jgi:hypothetical protein
MLPMTVRTKLLIYSLVALVILLGGITLILAPSNSTVPGSIGTSLVASGCVALLDLLYKSIIGEEFSAASSILESGLVEIYDRRDIEKYHPLMKSLSSRLDITGYSLRSFSESFSQILVDRLDKCSGLHVRLLVVDPTSTLSKTRELLEEHAPGTFAKSIEALKRTYRLIPNVEIRALQTELTTMVFRLDRTMFVGPQFLGTSSRATVTLEIHEGRDSWLFRAYEREFETMWSQGHAI